MVLRAASITKGGSGPFDLDAEGWRQILTSNSFGTASLNLHKSIADFVKNFCSKRINSESQSLKAFVACSLIPQNKNPGLRPIGVGEVLPQTAGKAVINILY